MRPSNNLINLIKGLSLAARFRRAHSYFLMNLFMILLTVLLLTAISTIAVAVDRCKDYTTDVRISYAKYFGVTYPWWYGIGCMKQESMCRADIVSFDGGIGLFQLTPSTGIIKDIEKELGIIIDSYSPAQNSEAHAYYISRIYFKYSTYMKVNFRGEAISPKTYTEKCGNRLSTMYRHFNGGWWYYYEAYKANKVCLSCHKEEYTCDRNLIKKFCTRGGVWVGKGDKKKWLSFCDVNYSYPEKVYEYGLKYKLFEDSLEWKY